MKNSSYSTGGKIEPRSGTLPGLGEVHDCDVTMSGAGMGTTYHNPNVRDDKGPGGYGSVGSKSTSKPTGMKY